MRRLIARLGVILLSTAVLVLSAAPAFAAQGGEESPSTGSSTGLMLALILGVVVGLVVFIDVHTGEEPDVVPHPPREH